MNSADLKEIESVLAGDLSPKVCQLYGRQLHALAENFMAYHSHEKKLESAETFEQLVPQLTEFLIFSIKQKLQEIETFNNLQRDFSRRYLHSLTSGEQEETVLEFAKALGASPTQLAGDRKAFKRWFGFDAVAERCQKSVSSSEYALAFQLSRFGDMAALALAQQPDPEHQSSFWQRLDFEEVLKELLAYGGDKRVRVATFCCLSKTIQALSPQLRTTSVEYKTQAFIYRSSLETREDIWIQSEALSLVKLLSFSSLEKVLERRLLNPLDGDDFFVRKCAIVLLCENWENIAAAEHIVNCALYDPSSFVRQGLAFASRHLASKKALAVLKHLAIGDNAPQVRAAALFELSRIALQDTPLSAISEIFIAAIEQESDVFVLRTALHSVCQKAKALAQLECRTELNAFCEAMFPLLEASHQRAEELAVRRWSALAKEQLFVLYEPEAAALKKALEELLHPLPMGESVRVNPSLINSVSQEIFGRVLSLLSQEDFSYHLCKGWFGIRITRGDTFKFRWWRFIYEVCQPTPDKRQAHNHTIGRCYRGHLRAPSAILSELSQTKVPGEPFFIATESCWRPYLPLLDEVISAFHPLYFVGTIYRYTAEGVTEMTPPCSRLRRLIAWGKLTWNFSHYARLRNWIEESQNSPGSYIRELAKLGVAITFRGHRAFKKLELDEDPAVKRFFQPEETKLPQGSANLSKLKPQSNPSS